LFKILAQKEKRQEEWGKTYITDLGDAVLNMREASQVSYGHFYYFCCSIRQGFRAENQHKFRASGAGRSRRASAAHLA
jgi:hypothetical protein